LTTEKEFMMGYLDLAMDEVKRRKAELAEKERQEAAYLKGRRAELRNLEDQVQAALHEFDGLAGIKHVGNRLLQGNQVIAFIDIAWETWQNPNCEAPCENSGYIIRYRVEGRRYDDPCRQGEGLEDFARAMAEHLMGLGL
jgi:hypothetical protein